MIKWTPMTYLAVKPQDPDQSFRVRFVLFRFVLFTLLPLVSIGGFMWAASGMLVSVLLVAILCVIIAAIVSIRDYVSLGKLMRKIEAERRQKEACGQSDGASSTP